MVRKLAADKFNAIADEVKAEGWAWVTSALERAYEPFDHIGTSCEVDGEPAYSAEQMAGAGAKVTLEYSGEVCIERGLVEPRSRAKAAETGEAVDTGVPECPATMIAE